MLLHFFQKIEDKPADGKTIIQLKKWGKPYLRHFGGEKNNNYYLRLFQYCSHFLQFLFSDFFVSNRGQSLTQLTDTQCHYRQLRWRLMLLQEGQVFQAGELQLKFHDLASLRRTLAFTSLMSPLTSCCQNDWFVLALDLTQGKLVIGGIFSVSLPCSYK